MTSRDRLDDARLVVHRLERDEAHAALAERALEVLEVDRRPSARTRTQRTRARPSRSSASATRATDGCSRRLVDERARLALGERATAARGCSPRCPPDVSTTSRGSHRASARHRLARVLDARARRAPVRVHARRVAPRRRAAARAIASTTSGSGGVVAFQSR